MKRFFSILVFSLVSCLASLAQTDSVFKRTIYNKEYDLFIVMNFYDKNVVVPGQDFMGEMDGYLGDYKDFRKWFIMSADIKKGSEAQLSISNDEGSEDLTATLTCENDGTYTLRQKEGSTLKIARNRKWVKLPKAIVFTKKRE